MNRHLARRGKQLLPQSLWLEVVLKLVNAMERLGVHKLIHFDLKWDNVLIHMNNGELKSLDFKSFT